VTRLWRVIAALVLLLPGLGLRALAEEPPPPKEEPPAENVELPDLPGLNLPGIAPPWAKTDHSPAQSSAEIQISLANDEPVIGEPLEFVLRGPARILDTAHGSYLLRDDLGRIIISAPLKPGVLKPDAEDRRRFSVPAFQPVTVAHTLDLMLDAGEAGRISRVCAFSLRRHDEWNRWLTLVHAPYANEQWPVLQQAGIQGSMAYRLNAERHTALRTAGVPFFVENVARSFLSRYRAERGLWERTVARAIEDPAGTGALVREPSLWDRRAAEVYVRELQRHATRYRDDQPLFYSLAAEPSVTYLAAPFDFDYHPDAVAEFRRWLERDVFGTLNALNAAWGTNLKSWDEIQACRTDEALRNLADGRLAFGPWMAFRAFQDVSLAKALKEGGRILRESDPRALTGITGAQGPFAFGGWDWTRLAESLDVCEAYDIGGARELWRDLAPGKPALGVLPLVDDPQRLPGMLRTFWSIALEGGPRGALLWDEAPGEGAASRRFLLTPDGQPGPAAVMLGPTLRELSGPLGQLLARAHREPASVGLLYSPASVRMNWLLEAARLHPKDWLKAWGENSAAERCESNQLRLRVSWMALLADLGLPWRFVSTNELERGTLAPAASSLRVLVLPRTIALSGIEVAEIKSFVAQGGTVIADALCGRFNEHGLVRATPPLDELFGLDTSREPFSAEPPHPLETLRDASEAGKTALVSKDLIVALPPAFSDKPAWIGPPPAARVEYRRSPVLARREQGKGVGLYLNLDIEGYLGWRLHPERPRAAALRSVLAQLALGPGLALLPEDLEASSLPPGTEIVRLRCSTETTGTRLLALRRNPQTRLHELGLEGDTNEPFDRPAPFKIVWRQPCWVADLRLGGAPERRTELEGTLDPVTPTLLAVMEKEPPKIEVTCPADARLGSVASIPIKQPGGGRLFSFEVKGPDRLARPHYGRQLWTADGNAELLIPLAVSDPSGDWTLEVREWATSASTRATLKVAPAK
jgi:hypothetical protein